MKFHRLLSLLGLSLLLTACALLSPGPDTAEAPATEESGDEPTSTPRPDQPEGTLAGFLGAWQAADYPSMYNNYLSARSQEQTTPEFFVTFYTDVDQTLGLNGIDYEIADHTLSTDGSNAQYVLNLTYQTTALGSIDQEITYLLTQEADAWKIVWSRGLVFPQISGGNSLDVESFAPERASIYDRNGEWLVTNDMPVMSLTIVPGEAPTDEETLDDMLVMLSEMLRIPTETIYQNFAGAPPDSQIALGDVDQAIFDQYRSVFLSYPGLNAYEKTGARRDYDVLAPHIMGYTSYVQAAQIAEGRQEGEIIGQAGLEQWGEQYLAGVRGGTLMALSPDGVPVAEVFQRDSQPSQNLYTTIDRDLQAIVQDAIEGAYRAGEPTWAPTAGGAAVVVLDVNSGAVRAIASYPYYDPNVLVPANSHPFATEEGLNQMLNGPLQPLINRPLQGLYPLGSVFKIVSTATALESGLFVPDSTYTCTGTWTGLGAEIPYPDWKEGGHGLLTLAQGLTASCNPWFYEIGMRTGRDSYDLLPDMARTFGFGTDTGIELEEQVRPVPDPDWLAAERGETWSIENSVNLAVGQGDLLVTPLQVAVMIAAVANGGTIYEPYLVDRIGETYEDATYIHTIANRGQADVSQETLDVIRESMRQVVVDQQIGTAEGRLGSIQISAAGKTGTAQVSGTGYPNAWFAGFVPFEDPELAIVILVENGGQGSTVASPIFRRIVERWYDLSVFRWPLDWGDPEIFEFVTEDGIGE